MSAPWVRAVLTAATTGLCLSLLVGSAWAQTTPSPTTTDPVTASPEPVASSPAPETGDPSSPPASGDPEPPVETSPPAPTASASGTPPPLLREPTPEPIVEAPEATGSFLAPVVPSDGVDPAPGQTDDYLEAAAARDAAAGRVTLAAAAVVRAQAALAALEDGRRTVAMTTALARIDLVDAQRSTDDVVRDLYQQGDAGVGAIATILSSGPDGLLDRVANARMATSTAAGVVDRAAAARDRLDAALAAQRAYDGRLTQSRAAIGAAQKALDQARIELATADARLTALGSVAPQVTVGIDGCPTANVPATLRDGAAEIGVATLCRSAVRQAATPQAALALTWAFQHLGAVYACKGVGRMEPWRADCSSFVSRAYAEGAGIGTAGTSWAPSTRNMVPWDGVALDPHYARVAPQALRPGDLVLYDTCPQGGCPYKHVVMYLGSPDGGRTTWMLHTNACGDVAKVTAFWGFPSTGHPFLVARRVLALPGEQVRVVAPAEARLAAAIATHRATSVVSRLIGAA